MKRFASALRRALFRLGGLFSSEPPVDRPAVLKSEEFDPVTSEAERLDRLRNPRDYQGR